MPINNLKKWLCLFLAIFIIQGLGAQDLLRARDLSQVKVDLLSNEDIAKIKAQINSSGLSIDEIEKMAVQKGMSVTEFGKLKQRLVSDRNPGSNTGKLGSVPVRTQSRATTDRIGENDTLDVADYGQRSKPLINPLIFGSEMYTSASLSFEPNLKLATPVNYVLGPEDQVNISVYGIQEYSGEFLVSPEGNINIPSVGQVKVAGLTIEAATQKLKTVMGNGAYPYLKTGGAKLSVTLGNIRSITVTIIGSNNPGNYTISSLASVFNALHAAGGPSEFGSFRKIELLRNNKLERVIDLYRFLLRGDQSDNIGLKDNDVIRIPAYISRVEIQGQVKRPGIFEVLPGEKFADVLAFASGFSDTAYKASIKVYQQGDRERFVKDVQSQEYSLYEPRSGDVFIVSKILNRFQNRVRINGAVFRPDTYELLPQMKVADLIRRADGLQGDAFSGRGQILRLNEDYTRAIVSFDVRRALAGDSENNVLLQREDEVYISSILDLRDSLRVDIQGEIRLPGQYVYAENLTLKDLILQAGGFTDAAYKTVEVARLIKRDSITVSDMRASNIINVEIDGDLVSSNSDITLQPFDVVTIRRKSGYILPETVTIHGQVQFPGPYVLSAREERVSNLVKRAGGFAPDAFPEGAYLKRYKTPQELEKSKDVVRKLQKAVGESNNNASGESNRVSGELSSDTAVLIRGINAEITRTYDNVPLNFDAIMKSPGSVDDIVLRDKDELFIPKFNDQVKVSGAVLLATQIPFQKDHTLLDYVSDAGGFSGSAWNKKAYVVYANGKAATAKRFLFFTKYPKVLPGSELVVPEKPAKKNVSMAEIIGISSAIASLAGVVIALLRL